MAVSPEKTTIGFIGIGVMGQSMAGHLIDKGYNVHVYTRTKSKAENTCSKGGVWEDSVKSLSQKSDVVITIVGLPEDVREVYLGESGIFQNAKPGTITIDMTTSSPELAKELYQRGKESSIKVVDAPVSGGDIGAQNATLSIMVGTDNKTFEAVLPLFEIMGANIVLQGSAGSGQHTKAANQIAIAAGMIGVCESLAYAKKAGLDPATVLESIGKGAAGSWSLNNLGPRMIAKDFDPGFFVKHFIKDMNIAAEASKSMELETPGLKLAKSLYEKLAAKGCENDGTQALYKLFSQD
jgi:3-hydroxyisobutyrate dehydrogenase